MSFAPITLRIHGIPAPQGSKRHVGGGRMIETSKRLPAWRDSMVSAMIEKCVEQWITRPVEGPVAITVSFDFPMPQSRPAKIKDAGRAWKVTAPDLDKLLRAAGDALQISGMVKNDSQICHIITTKTERTAGPYGCTITITSLNTSPPNEQR